MELIPSIGPTQRSLLGISSFHRECVRANGSTECLRRLVVSIKLRNFVGMTSTTIQDQSRSSSSHDHVKQIDIAINKFENLIERFGFLPQESIVVIWQRDGEELLVQRSDLPASGNLDQWIGVFLQPIVQYTPNGVDIFIHSSGSRESLTEFSLGFTSELHDRGIATHTNLLICESRAYLTDCGRQCDSHEWTLNSETSLSGSREQLAQTFAYDPTVGVSRKIRRQARKNFYPVDRSRRLSEIDFIESFLTDGVVLSEKIIARVATACLDIPVRDVILWSLAHSRLKDVDAAEKLSDLLPHLRGRWSAPVATMAAISWWVSGNGAKANMCVDRALAENPSYSLATLVRVALVHGVSASFWIEAVTELSREECLLGEQVPRQTGVPLAQ